MANNGGEQQRMEKLEVALRDEAQALAAVAAAASGNDHYLARADRTEQLLGDVGRGLGDLGQRDQQEIAAFIEHQRHERQQFIGDLLMRKRRDLTHLEKVIKGATAGQGK
jgi:uncharacterized protein YydD (DUF2326 family)